MWQRKVAINIVKPCNHCLWSGGGESQRDSRRRRRRKRRRAREKGRAGTEQVRVVWWDKERKKGTEESTEAILWLDHEVVLGKDQRGSWAWERVETWRAQTVWRRNPDRSQLCGGAHRNTTMSALRNAPITGYPWRQDARPGGQGTTCTTWRTPSATHR